jgi:hypothetical protein
MSRKLVLMAVVAGLGLVHAAGAELRFQPVALAGLPAPGLTNNVRFAAFEDVSLADDGRIAFTAQLMIGPGVTFTNNQGLWAGLPGDLRLVARTGDSVPGDTNGNTFTYFWKPNIDNHQAVGFLAHDPDHFEKLLAQGIIGMIDPFLDTGPPPTPFRIRIKDIAGTTIKEYRAAIASLFGFVINTTAGRVELLDPEIGPTNKFAIVAGPPTNVVVVARTGFPAPGVAGNFAYFSPDSQAMALTPDGNVAFQAQAYDGPALRNGLWFGKAGTVQLVALQNRPAPVSLLGPGYTFGSIGNSAVVEVNARGELAFTIPMNGPGLNSTNSDFLLAGPPGGLRIIARSGQPAPGIPGAVFAGFSYAMLGTDGTVAFTAPYSTNGTDYVYAGLWLAPTNGASPILLMHAGQRAPGTPADVYFKNSPTEAYFMNSRNQVVFRSRLTGPGLNQFDNGIWLAEPDGKVHLIARTGDMVDTGGGVMAQVGNVGFGVDPEISAGPEDGRRTPFNNRGEIALRVLFDTPPPPLRVDGGIFIARTGISLNAERVGNDLRVKLPTLAGKSYRVEFTTNVPAATWNSLPSPIAGTGAEVTVTDTNAAALPRRFYRAVRTD